jgi:chromosome segregation ATPase
MPPGETDGSREHSSPLVPHSASDEGASLATEVELLRSQDRHRTTRIHHLEQALDQALSCLEEMRLKVQEQGMLESQLAATEKFACVQQQAIARLRLRIKQQQQVIDAHLIEVRDRSRSLMQHTLHPDTRPHPSLNSPGPGAFHLDSQVQALQAALTANQHRMTELEQEAQQAQELASRLQGLLETAQQQVQNLSIALSLNDSRIAELEAQLADTPHPNAEAIALGHTPGSTKPRWRAQHNPAIATLGHDLAKAQIKVEELEIELARQLRLQSMWQHRCHEVQTEGDRHRHRSNELEQQTLDLQEQVFQQAQQSTEYEAAIQHWKDQYLTSQRQIAHLRELLEETQLYILANEQSNPALSALFSELLAVVEFATLIEGEDLQSQGDSPAARFTLHDIPEFLLRRRNYRPY